MKPLRIVCHQDELVQGLFGQTFYYLLQVLPYLSEHGIFPAWGVRTLYYGDAPDYMTVPGVLDLVYTPPPGPYRTISLHELRRRHAHVLGNDWAALNNLWSRYFSIPKRVMQKADAIFPRGRVLGVHYRGTDKQTATWDSNPISQDEYIMLVRDFLDHRGGFEAIAASSDEPSFIDKLSASVPLPVLSLGAVEFHMAEKSSIPLSEKGDRAVLDCVLFSRCECLIETSSALPSFAKLLNPGLEVYRCAASKLFGKLYSNMPYFPVAHIPHLPVTSEECRELLRRTMDGDWTFDPQMAKYQLPFVSMVRWPVNNTIFSAAEKVGIDRLVGRVITKHF